MLKQLTTTVALISLTSCASIISGSSQNISVSTEPPTQANCSLTNSRGNWNTGTTPAHTVVKRSQSQLNVNCDSANYTGQLEHHSDVEGWAFTNVLWGLGGLIGLTVDGATGSLFSYDDHLVVPLKAKYGSNVSIEESAPTMPIQSMTPPTPAPMMQEQAMSPAPQPKTLPVIVPSEPVVANTAPTQTYAPTPAPMPTPAPRPIAAQAAPTQGFVSQIAAPTRAAALPPSQF